MIQCRVFVTGEVQGVGFRAATFRQARKQGALRGYVRNLDDGRVEAVFLGAEPEVKAMLEWCRKGPPSASVTKLEVLEEAPDGALVEFQIRY
ncbi:MAG: acylphosphatase [Oligoflexia bacterium]|nr:acylphosphatase [Oligoflexia bacterium]